VAPGAADDITEEEKTHGKGPKAEDAPPSRESGRESTGPVA